MYQLNAVSVSEAGGAITFGPRGAVEHRKDDKGEDDGDDEQFHRHPRQPFIGGSAGEELRPVLLDVVEYMLTLKQARKPKK